MVNPKQSSPFNVSLQSILSALLTFAVCLTLAACTKSVQPNAIGSPSPAPTDGATKTAADAQPAPNTTRDGKPPTAAEAQAALERVYRKVVVPGGNAPASVVTGDFNGDGSEDIAIAVTPAKDMLAEINSEFANWILADAKRVAVFDPKKHVQSLPAQSGPVRVESSDDALLAIVHGHGPKGWHDRDATQSYLLKNAAGAGMRVMPLRSFPPALKVIERGAASRADIIIQTLGGKPGFLYWAAGKYAWYEQ